MKVLRPYQQDTVLRLEAEPEHDFLVEQPTGAGKTLEAVALTTLLLPAGNKVLIASPQEHIERNFTQRDYVEFELRGVRYSAPQRLLRAARAERLGTIAEGILSYLKRSSPGYALVCTHAALTRVRPPTGIPNSLAGCVLIVDEAHHAPAKGLSQFVTSWKKAGGRVLYFTATGYRSDNLQVVLPGMQVIRRTLAEHMDEGYAPATIDSKLFTVSSGSSVTERMILGEEAPEQTVQRRMIPRLVQQWRDEGRPKLIVRVPPLRGGSIQFAKDIVAAFGRAGATVVDASGTEPEAKENLLCALTSEQTKTDYTASEVDVIVGIQRVAEGLDWRWCSTVYCVGIPRSISSVIQLLGRATRRKDRGYPASHRDVARLAFFVPVETNDAATISEKLSRRHSEQVLLVCSFLASGAYGQEWLVMRHVGKTLGMSLSSPEMSQKVREAFPYIDPEIRAQVDELILMAVVELTSGGVSATVGAILDRVKELDFIISDSVVRQVMLYHLVDEQGMSSSEAKAAIRDSVERKVSSEQTLKRQLIAAFDDAVSDLRDETLTIESPTFRALRQVHTLQSDTVTQYGRRVRDSLVVIPELVNHWLEQFRREHGHYPTVNCTSGSNFSWAEVDRIIMTGEQGWARYGQGPVLPGGLQEYIETFCQRSLGRSVAAFREAVVQSALTNAVLDYMLDCQLVRPEGRMPAGAVLLSGSAPEAQFVSFTNLANFWRGYFIRNVASESPVLGAAAYETLIAFHSWEVENAGSIDWHVDPISSVDKGFWSQRFAEVVCFRTPRKVTYTDGQECSMLAPDTMYFGIMDRCPFSMSATDRAALVLGSKRRWSELSPAAMDVPLLMLSPVRWEEIVQFESADETMARRKGQEVFAYTVSIPFSWLHSHSGSQVEFSRFSSGFSPVSHVALAPTPIELTPIEGEETLRKIREDWPSVLRVDGRIRPASSM